MDTIPAVIAQSGAVAQEVFNRLDALATQLGVTVEYLWPVMVQQFANQGAFDLWLGGGLFVVGLLCVLGGILVAYIVGWYDDGGFAFLLGVVVGITPLIAGLAMSRTGYLMVKNPEFYALQEVLTTLGR